MGDFMKKIAMIKEYFLNIRESNEGLEKLKLQLPKITTPDHEKSK